MLLETEYYFAVINKMKSGFAMRKFDTYVQELKYRILREVARHTWEGRDGAEMFTLFNEIASTVVHKDNVPMRCCIYKDRAIVAEQIRIALGGNCNDPNIVEVIGIACDECPQSGYVVTDLCRGCIAHKCEDACKVNAIENDGKLIAHINKDKCIECGRCAKVCPYNAIINFKSPCEVACKADAIHIVNGEGAKIDERKCTNCGLCVTRCPFGAAVDKSYITHVIRMLMASVVGTGAPVHAIVAPAIAAQFNEGTLGQLVSGIKALGFADVREVALGADLVAYEEAEAIREDGFMTTSCCPAFVKYIKSQFPELIDNISPSLSPMAMLGKLIKDKEPDSKVVFIGPCIAKKAEAQLDSVAPYIDRVLTFEELQAMLDAREIDITVLEETMLEESSSFGRGFAKSGGVAAAVVQAIEEQGSGKQIKTGNASGLDKCKPLLRAAIRGTSPYQLLEGMACDGGCIGGAACLTHDAVDEKRLAESGQKAAFDEIGASIRAANR